MVTDESAQDPRSASELFSERKPDGMPVAASLGIVLAVLIGACVMILAFVYFDTNPV